MIYSGIISGPGGAQIKNASITVYSSDGLAIVKIPADQHGYWEFDTDFDGGLLDAGNKFSFNAPGYIPYGVSASAIQETFDVSLLKNQSALPLLLLGGAITIGVMSMSKGKKKVGAVKFDNETVKTGLLLAGGIIAFTVTKKVLETTGIWQSADDKKLSALATDPGSFWNPNYWQTVNPSGAGYNSALTEADALSFGWKLYNAMGYGSDDADAVKNVFRSLHTKANASFIAWKFAQPEPSGFGKDLLSYLKNGKGVFPWNGLAASDIVAITDYVNSLPNY